MTTSQHIPGACGPASSQKLRVLYIQPGTKVFAGIERVVDSVCTELVTKYGADFDVDVLYTTVHENFPPELRDYNVIRRVSNSLFSRAVTYRNVIKEGGYDIVVVPQVEPTVFCWLSCLGLNARFAMHLHGNPAHEKTHLKAMVMFALAGIFVIRRISCVFGTSPRQLESFVSAYGGCRRKFWLPNPVRRFDNVTNPRESHGSETTFVNVGRFDYQKGQDILIDAFSKLYGRQPNVRLKLVGHGSDEQRLREQIDRLGLRHVVDFEYLPTNPQAALAASDVYVSTSRWEGWSLVICEALRFGLPVIAVDCDFGPSDILQDARLGVLVPPFDERALVDAMSYYHDNLGSERAFAGYRKDYVDQFSPENVVHFHAEALRSAATRE